MFEEEILLESVSGDDACCLQHKYFYNFTLLILCHFFLQTDVKDSLKTFYHTNQTHAS